MKVTFFFTNLDNYMGTDEKASVTMDISADDSAHVTMLCEHLQRVLHADHYQIGERMKVYIVKEWNECDLGTITAVYSKYEDAVEHAEDLAEYGGFERHGDRWFAGDDEMVEIETHEVK